MSRYRTILLFGAPGAGKGTQGKVLGQVPGFFHLSCGDVFRTMDMNSPLGKIFREYSGKGLLVPDEPTIQMWHKNMEARTILSQYKPTQDLLVLDGIPRNVHQASLLDKYLKVLKIIHLVCPDREKMISRLQRRALKENRIDDAREDVIRKRWDVYTQETHPVLEHYPRELIAEIDAMGSPAEVLEKILAILVPVQNAHFANALSGEAVPAPIKGPCAPGAPASDAAGKLNGKAAAERKAPHRR